MAEAIINLIDRAGYLGIFFIMFVETVFPPIPSELIMPFAGYIAAQGRLDIVAVIITGTLGSLAGATLLYLIARLISDDLLNRFIDRYGHWLTIERSELDRARVWFHRYSSSTVLIARLVPAVRSIISVPSGIAKMEIGRFLFFSFVGTALWVTILTILGYILGSNYSSVEGPITVITEIIVVLMVLVYLYRLIRYFVRKKRPLATG